MNYKVKFSFVMDAEIVIEAKDAEEAKKKVMIGLETDAFEPADPTCCKLKDYGCSKISAEKTDQECSYNYDIADDSALNGMTIDEYYEKNKDNLTKFMK